MRWQGGRQSENVEDRRGMSVGRGGIAVGGGLGTVILVLLVMFLGGDPRAVLEQAQQAPPQQARDILEEGDIEEALTAAAAIGDDRLQKRSQGYVVPESFTHGTSAQRVRWFRKGLQTGDMSQGDTFSARDL